MREVLNTLSVPEPHRLPVGHAAARPACPRAPSTTTSPSGATTAPGSGSSGLARRKSAWRRTRADAQRRCIDSQSVKTTEVGGDRAWVRRRQENQGRKRHLLVDTLGLLIAVLITGAGLDDGVAAPRLLAQVTPADFPRLGTIFADQKYHNHVFEAWLAEHRAGWRLDVKMRPEGTKGFTPLAKRWVVERTNAWHGRYRRNSKDYERTVESSTAMIQMSNIHLMLNKLVPCSHPTFHYRTEAA